MSSVLVLEAFGINGPPIVEAVAGRGHQVLLASHQNLFDAFAPEVTGLVDEFWDVDFGSDDIVEVLVDRASGRDVVGVVTGWEFFTPLAALVADRLGLPGHDPDRVLAARNKKEMAAAFGAAGVRHARTIVVAPDADLGDLAEDLRYPLVVKPSDNAGSCGVSVISDRDALDEAVAQARSWPTEFPHDIPLDVDVLVQDYVGGREYSVESLGIGGEVTHVAITEKLTTSGSARAEVGHIVPARIEPAVHEAITTEVTKALQAVGFRHGVAHTEVKVDDGLAWIIETGVRPGGDLIPRLVQLATGLDLIDAYVAAATGRRVELPVGERAVSAALVRFIVPPRDGIVEVLDNAPTGAHVVEAVFSKKAGDRIEAVSDNVSRLGHFVLVGTDPAELSELGDRLLGEVKVEVR